MFKSEGASWVFSDRFGEVRDGFFVLALPGVKLASLLPEICAFWIELNSRTAI